jgi:hypothetical protein
MSRTCSTNGRNGKCILYFSRKTTKQKKTCEAQASFYRWKPNVAIKWLAFLLRILEFPGSNLGLQTVILAKTFRVFFFRQTGSITTASFHILSNSLFDAVTI